MNKHHRIFVAGHHGLVGSAIVRRLHASGYDRIVTREHRLLDLRRQADVEAFFAEAAIDVVILAAATVGGIHANNTRRAEFIRDNLQIQTNVIAAAHQYGVGRLLFLGSSCIYPRDCPQPIREGHLLGGPLEATNEPYAVAKIAGLKMCEAYNDQYGTCYATVMPTNLYGPGDNFELDSSHVIPALLHKMHRAKIEGQPVVSIWGSGTPKREFLYVDDLAEGGIFVLERQFEHGMINIGSGDEITIANLAETIAKVVGYTGNLRFDDSMPDGTPRKLLDSSRIRGAGWAPRYPLIDGLRDTYRWFVKHADEGMTSSTV